MLISYALVYLLHTVLLGLNSFIGHCSAVKLVGIGAKRSFFCSLYLCCWESFVDMAAYIRPLGPIVYFCRIPTVCPKAVQVLSSRIEYLVIQRVGFLASGFVNHHPCFAIHCIILVPFSLFQIRTHTIQKHILQCNNSEIKFHILIQLSTFRLYYDFQVFT